MGPSLPLQDELGRCEHEIFEARGILVGLGDLPPSLTCPAEPKPEPATAKKRQGKKMRPESFFFWGGLTHKTLSSIHCHE